MPRHREFTGSGPRAEQTSAALVGSSEGGREGRPRKEEAMTTMQKTKRSLVLAPLAVLAVLTVLAPAAGAAELRANIPFSFTVNSMTLPPGTYTLSETGSALFVRGVSKGAVVLTGRIDSRERTRPSLVFHKYGSQYVLRQAWTGAGSGRQVPETRHERELAQAASRTRSARGFERVVISLM
jgi:hypothetical protein